MRFRVLPYNQASVSARNLARELGGLVLYRDPARSRFVARPDDVIVSWGNHTAPLRYGGREPGLILNQTGVANASNKLKFFRHALNWATGRKYIFPWTTSQDLAQAWVDGGKTVVVRHLVSSRQGRGIEIIERGAVPEAPLYTLYMDKTAEYRVHATRTGEVFWVQQKRRRRSVPDEQVNWQVRNEGNGFVFCIQNVNPPACVLEAGREAVRNLGLDFGGVDVIYNEATDKAYIVEVNTAPGIEATTLTKYGDMIRARTRAFLIANRFRNFESESEAA